jgi:predicted RNase H-like HicB family nuclease
MPNEQEFAKGRQVLLYTDEDGNWIAEVPSLPGCGSDGTTREEALERVKEAVQGYVEALLEDNLPVPEDLPNLEVVTVTIELTLQ